MTTRGTVDDTDDPGKADGPQGNKTFTDRVEDGSMDRRALLSAVGCSLVGLAGCIDDADTTPSANGSASDGSANESAGASDDETTTITDLELRKPEHVVSTYEPATGRGIDPDDVVPEDEIPTALRDPLAEARAGTFETDSVSESLLAAVDAFRHHRRGELKPYVVLDGTRFAFDPTVPTFTAELADGEPDDYDETRTFTEQDRLDLEPGPVKDFVHALTASGTHVPRDEYRRCVLPEAVDEFLDEYDYLTDQLGVARIETATENEDPPYTITVRELTAETMWGRPVVDASALDDDLVAFFERALASPHRKPALTTPDRSQYFTDDVPDAYGDFAAEYERPPYVRIDGTVRHVIVGTPRYDRIPVSVTTTGVDDADAAFTLTVSPAPENVDGDVEGPYTFTSRGALPSALWVFHDGERRSLEVVDTEGVEGPNPTRSDSEVLETANAGEEIAATYAVPADLPDGTYVSRGLFRISWNVPGQTPGEHGTYPFELAVTVE